MYGELGAVKGIVDLSPEHALDEAAGFLASQGYSILRRTSTTLTAERRSSEESAGEAVPNLSVVVMPQPEGGVQIKIRGNDFEGVQARQTEWMGWSESLPRKAEGEAGAPTEEQGSIQTPEVELPPPPTVESPTLPAPAPAAEVQVAARASHYNGTPASEAGVHGVARYETCLRWLCRPSCVARYRLRGMSCPLRRRRGRGRLGFRRIKRTQSSASCGGHRPAGACGRGDLDCD